MMQFLPLSSSGHHTSLHLSSSLFLLSASLTSLLFPSFLFYLIFFFALLSLHNFLFSLLPVRKEEIALVPGASCLYDTPEQVVINFYVAWSEYFPTFTTATKYSGLHIYKNNTQAISSLISTWAHNL